MYKTFEMELAGRTLRVDVGRVCAQANGAARQEGAYCIALKGLYEINKIKQNWSDDKKLKESELYIGVTEWLDYIQNRRFE